MRTISNAQQKSIIDTEQQFGALRDARLKLRTSYAGGMHWKHIKGTDYLYRTQGGRASSLGPRSPETEQKLANFLQEQKAATERFVQLSHLVATAAKINVVYRAGHVPNEVADVCTELDDAGLLDKNITIIGTHAMHVYEAMAGVRFEADIMATTDVDLLWNHRSKCSIATSQALEEGGLLKILRKADRSYSIQEDRPYRAYSPRTGFMVDLIRQMPDPPWADEPDRFFTQDDLVATDIWNMNWMLGAPREIRTVIAMDGRPFRMAAPDPRAFAMFKLWLGTACEDREPTKKPRDLAQAEAVMGLINDHLPHLARSWPQMRSFPTELAQEAATRAERMRS